MAAVVLGKQAGALKHTHAPRIGAQGVLQRAVAVGRIPYLETRAVVGIHAAPVQIVTGAFAAIELALEEPGGRFQCRIQLAAVVLLLRRALLGLAWDFHAGALGQLVDRVEKLEAVVIHQETNRGAMCAAAEAMIELLGRRHSERGRALVMERAACRVFLALTLERHATAHHLDDVGACEQFVDKRVGDAGHPASISQRPAGAPVSPCSDHVRQSCGNRNCPQPRGSGADSDTDDAGPASAGDTITGGCSGSTPASRSLRCERTRSSITAVIKAPTKNTTEA